jgi:hypothetical protein
VFATDGGEEGSASARSLRRRGKREGGKTRRGDEEGTPGLLTPGALLVPEECQHQRLAGTRTLLTPGLCWHQDLTDTRTWLASEASYGYYATFSPYQLLSCRHLSRKHCSYTTISLMSLPPSAEIVNVIKIA